MDSLDDIMLDAEDKMSKSLSFMQEQFGGIRTGKASPALVENVKVPYYGTPTRLKEIAGISSDRKNLVEKARSNKLSEEDMKNCRFVISNLGMYGVENFQPIISPPGVAIMGVGRLGEEISVVNGKAEIHNVMNVSFSFDHRVIDGSYAGLFYKYFKEVFENPALLAF